jgi:peptidoglycan-associated lipoprotein
MSMKRLPVFTILMFAAAVAACGPKKNTGTTPAPTPFPAATTPSATPTTAPPPPPKEAPLPPMIVPPDPGITTGDPFTRAAIEDINKDSPLKPVFFAYDSDVLDDLARKTMADNAAVMKKYGTWVITVEGHCDERGTAEYNLALGDRRAIAAKNYMVTLGIAADRVRTVSYGNEFPFDPAHEESAWSLNRRAHFMLTSK